MEVHLCSEDLILGRSACIKGTGQSEDFLDELARCLAVPKVLITEAHAVKGSDSLYCSWLESSD
jgi:hypothetical protein